MQWRTRRFSFMPASSCEIAFGNDNKEAIHPALLKREMARMGEKRGICFPHVEVQPVFALLRDAVFTCRRGSCAGIAVQCANSGIVGCSVFCAEPRLNPSADIRPSQAQAGGD